MAEKKNTPAPVEPEDDLVVIGEDDVDEGSFIDEGDQTEGGVSL